MKYIYLFIIDTYNYDINYVEHKCFYVNKYLHGVTHNNVVISNKISLIRFYKKAK